MNRTFYGLGVASIGLAFAFSACSHTARFAANRTPPYRVLVLGDSIPWGQGLAPKHKFTELVATALSSSLKREVVVTPHAHSGATIGLDADGSPDPSTSPGFKDGEVPTAYPTIWTQISLAQKAKTTYDLVIIDGCINDIKVSTILNPLPWALDLEKVTRIQCYEHLRKLLLNLKSSGLLAAGGKVVVTGYYRILSWDSNNLPSATETLRTFLVALSSTDKAAIEERDRNQPKVVSASRNLRCGPSLNLRGNMMCRAMLFKQTSDPYIRRAIAEANGTSPTIFLPAIPEIPSNRSAYANRNPSDNWIWVVRDRPILSAIDEAQPLPRIPDCYADYASNKQGRLFCKIASIGHPNPCGAIAYAAAVLSALQVAWKPPADEDCGKMG
jgi:lysophospholipase L1-like esterase